MKRLGLALLLLVAAVLVAPEPAPVAGGTLAGFARSLGGLRVAVVDAVFLQAEFRLEQFELQADRAEFLAQEKFLVGEGEPVGRGACLCGFRGRPRPFRILAGARQDEMLAVFVFHVVYRSGLFDFLA